MYRIVFPSTPIDLMTRRSAIFISLPAKRNKAVGEQIGDCHSCDLRCGCQKSISALMAQGGTHTRIDRPRCRKTSPMKLFQLSS
jgi:hypothetical protein